MLPHKRDIFFIHFHGKQTEKERKVYLEQSEFPPKFYGSTVYFTNEESIELKSHTTHFYALILGFGSFTSRVEYFVYFV